MVVNEFKIVNNDSVKGLKFHWGEVVADNITINNVTIAAAGQSSTANFATNFGGFRRLITVDFTLFNDGTDKSTDLSSKITLTQQWDHLMDTVVQGFSTAQSNVTFTLTTFSDGASRTYNGVLEDINLNGDPRTGGNKIEGILTLFISA